MDINQFLKEVLIFEDKEIKMVGTEEEPWFCGRDVCDVMEYDNYRNALKTHVKAEDKKSLYELRRSWGDNDTELNNETKVRYVSETGLYDLAIKSKKPAAVQFKDWITGEVLPSLRRTGKYEVKSNQEDVDALARHLKEQLRISELEKEQLKEEQRKKDEQHQQELEKKDEQHQQELKKQGRYTAEVERHNKLMNDLLVDNTKLKATQVIYIATTDRYASENKFKVGGIESCHKVDSRLGTYNTGRPKNDQMFFSDLFLVVNYKQIEERLKTLLSRFRDTARKEMYNMHYNDIKYVVKYCSDHYNEEVEYVNEHLDRFFKNLNKYNLRPVVPPPTKCNFTTITQCDEDGSVNTQTLEANTNKELVAKILDYVVKLKCDEISKKEVFDELNIRGNRKQLLPLVKSAFRLKRPEIKLLNHTPSKE